MKRLLNLALTLSIVCLASCDPHEENPDNPGTPQITLTAPTELAVADVTTSSAVLSWSGETDEYEVRVSGRSNFSVEAKTFTLTELTPGVEYTWSVRSVDGYTIGDWAEDETFITIPQAPEELNVSEITPTSAVFSWTGNASSYEIKIGEDTELVTDNTFTATELTPGTEYEWSVRAVKEDKASEWVEGPGFETFDLLNIEFPFIASKYYMGAQAAAGTSNFWLVLNSFDPFATGAAATGWQLSMDFFSSLVEKGSNGYYDIPDGTYAFGSSRDLNVINLTGMTRFTEFDEGTRITPDYTILDGEVNISGDPDEYSIEGYFNLEDGRRVEFTYQGAIQIS